MGEPGRRDPPVTHQSYHEGAHDNIRHLGQLIVQQGCGGMVCYLATTELIRTLKWQVLQSSSADRKGGADDESGMPMCFSAVYSQQKEKTHSSF